MQLVATFRPLDTVLNCHSAFCAVCAVI